MEKFQEKCLTKLIELESSENNQTLVAEIKA